MDIKVLKAEEARGMDATARKERVQELRKTLTSFHMDIYNPGSMHVGAKRIARKNLARMLTVLNEAGTKAPASKPAAKKPAVKKTATKAKAKK
jgi:ribosomal protein L29